MAGKEELIGQVSQLEAQEIEPVVERLNGLKELLMIVIDDDVSKRIKDEISVLESGCDSWWNKMSMKYNWDQLNSFDWEIDIRNGNVWIR